MKTDILGNFVEDNGDSWYKIDAYDQMPPFFMTLAADSDLWTFVSSAGSLTAGRQDQDRAFLPYETVDKIHLRWEHTGPRSWVWILDPAGDQLWTPFSQSPEGTRHQRSLWKNLSGTRLRFVEVHSDTQLEFSYEWSTAATLGLVRRASIRALGEPRSVRVLDGILNLMPPGVSFGHQTTMSSLADAYKWNESLADGRMGVFSLYAQIWDRAEPKESFVALTAWTTGLKVPFETLLSDKQVTDFCHGKTVVPETLTRGRRGAFLVHFGAEVTHLGHQWAQVVDSPLSQNEVFALVRRVKNQDVGLAEIDREIAANTRGVDELLARADGFQSSAQPIAAAHHRANVLFNIMRGGVFLDGDRWETQDFLNFVQTRNKKWGAAWASRAQSWGLSVSRSEALKVADELGPQAKRLALEYLPLTFSRRHGDPSRPWNRFSIRVRDGKGRRVVNYQGNWRDIFQNWEALVPSQPDYLGSMIAAFAGAMTPDGYNPYRVSRDGIDWEVVEPDNPWSNIGYWGDHQIIYLLRLLEAAQDRDPGLLATFWNEPVLSFADVPYRLKSHHDQTRTPKQTIRFDFEAHERSLRQVKDWGTDGRLVCDTHSEPVLATLGEKIAIILLAKASSLIPGGGLWLHTQRPEWNDANNALVGTGLSVVTLAYLRRLLVFLHSLPESQQDFLATRATSEAIKAYTTLLESTSVNVAEEPQERRRFFDRVGVIMDQWREKAYQGSAGRQAETISGKAFSLFVARLLPLVDGTLSRCRRADGLFDSYNVVDLSQDDRAEVRSLYPMLEGQVALLSSGFLSSQEALELVQRLFESPLFTTKRKSFLLYPDRDLPGFLDRNRLDDEALGLPLVQKLLAEGRTDILVRQHDGTVRFAPSLANRYDVAECLEPGSSDAQLLGDTYDRLLKHQEFTGRSGTMFAFEGLGCIYWHMVAKLLLALQEQAFQAFESGEPSAVELRKAYFRVREGLGYQKTPEEYGAFPADPYSHTPGEGGAQQPGMTGQVKEEILTRWGELGIQVRQGKIFFRPYLVDPRELEGSQPVRFTYGGVPWVLSPGTETALRYETSNGWVESLDRTVPLQGVLQVQAKVHFQRG